MKQHKNYSCLLNNHAQYKLFEKKTKKQQSERVGGGGGVMNNVWNKLKLN